MAVALHEHQAKGAVAGPDVDARTHNGWWVDFSPNTTLSVGNTGNAGKYPAALALQASAPLEVDALVDRQAEQMATQAIQPHLDRAGADPVAVADQARLARDGAVRVGDADAHRAAEIGPLRAFVEIDQQGQRMAGAAVVAQLAPDRLRRLGRHAVDAELARIARDEPLAEHLLGAGRGGQARCHMAAAEHLRRGQRMAALEQGGQHHAFQRLVVLGDDEVAQPLAHLRLDRRQARYQVGLVVAAHGKLGLELGIVRLEAELDVAVREGLHVTQHVVGARFANAEGVEALEPRHTGDAADLEQAGSHFFAQLGATLARNAGGKKEARLADGDGEAAGRADRVVDELGILRQHRLLLVVGRHEAAAPGVTLGHARHPVLAQYQRNATGLGRHLLREVVDGRAQTAIDDHRIGALAGLAESLQEAFPVVADGGAPVHGQPDIAEPPRHVAVIGVDGLAGQDLVAGAQDFYAHARRVAHIPLRHSDDDHDHLTLRSGRRPRLEGWATPRLGPTL